MHARRFPLLVQLLAVLVTSQLGLSCGLVDSGGADSHGADGSGAADSLGTGGQTSPWQPDDYIVEGCESPTYQATSFCYADCPRYDSIRARCDPLCTSFPASDCPPSMVPATGGAAPLLDPCEPAAQPASLGGAGGDGPSCAPG